ncbi:MAG: hypothetical protein ABI151_07660 [Chitinophagaceae bacterium]
MNYRPSHILLVFAFILLISSCEKTDTLATDKVTDYFPLVKGKYSTYILDSTVYVSFGQVKEIRRHYIKDVVDTMLTDNLGRPSFRIRRQFRNDTDSTKWEEHATYMVTPQPYSIEVIEDNLRFIKLQAPMTAFFTWNGNRFLPDETYTQFGFNSTAHSRLGSWEYIYTGIDASVIVNGKVFDHTVTIGSSVEDTTNFPPKDPNGPAFKTVWTEKYARGVGLVFREISLEEFQPKSSTYPNGYYSGFALKQTILDHN